MAEKSAESLRRTKELLKASVEGGGLRSHTEIEILSQVKVTLSREHKEAPTKLV